ncbi:hypothetical protein BO78DRAFT_399553 [Aspergillus sclerotiicarbonarius CBS 121057]|uniref:Uncharacterized protein n=1 Tax=Aspergillus sclerotiicarbonarius (strain CBS 121057 / IBT 28362) TaxID=1448318 RepID=A0A319E127_ASPSB|nr:hypothetical protein BO78DRAFT_399553 [Aspergillus sclerotiicarbonarius CBS 121057]
MSSQDSDSESSASSQTRSSKTPYQTFPLAHPPPKFTPRLRFLPRLLLQIQQLSSTSHRVLPILDIYQPPIQGKHLPNCPRKLHARDIYVLQSDAYTNLPAPRPGTRAGSEEGNANPKSENYPTTAGVIYFSSSSSSSCKRQQSQNQTGENASASASTSAGEADEIFFPSTQQSWIVNKTPKGYKFTSVAKDGTGTKSTSTTTLEWRKRCPGGRRPVSASGSGSTDSEATSTTNNENGKACEGEEKQKEDEKNPRFVLSGVSGGADRVRRSGLAGLEKKGLRIGGWEARQRRFLEEELGLGTGEEVYTVILTLGVYVGRAEGWM